MRCDLLSHLLCTIFKKHFAYILSTEFYSSFISHCSLGLLLGSLSLQDGLAGLEITAYGNTE